MPTKNPRINITVTPERYELLKRLAGLQGSSMSGLVSETMDMMYPVMERVCVVLEAAHKAQQTSKEGFRDSIAKAEAELLPMLYQAVGQFDMFVEDAAATVGVTFDSQEKASETILRAMNKGSSSKQTATKGAVGLSGSGGSTPRACDTGVRLSKEGRQPNKKGPKKS
jgi:hypothetical protein